MRRSSIRSSSPLPKMDSVISSSSYKPQFRSSATLNPYHVLSCISAAPKHRTPLWIAFSFSAAIAAVVCLLFLLARSVEDERYGIVIDAGSTGTRIHVYRYFSGTGSVPVVVDFARSETMKVNPGLSAYAGNSERAGDSIVELLEFGRKSVRRDLRGRTEVRLMATAGLRLLDDDVQERILESCRKALSRSGFLFRSEWASVITGSDEGIYAWVTANYALGTLGSDPHKTTGIIELGGASAQVTFASSEIMPPEFSYILKFGKTTHHLYSHSFLHFGQNVAYESLHKSLSSGNLKSSLRLMEDVLTDPCAPGGYPYDLETKFHTENTKGGHLLKMRTMGNFSECRSAALTLLRKGKDECLYQQCLMGSVFVPKLKGRFLATENFYYTSKFLGLHPTSFLSDMVTAGERFCGEDWMSLKNKYHFLAEEDLMRYCFSSAYIVAMLHDSLGIALSDKRIRFTNQIGDIPLDWALGAFVMGRLSDEASHSDSIGAIIDNNFSAVVLVLVILVLTCIIWSVSKWKKAQLKTIYDLEKGRYIITRVSP